MFSVSNLTLFLSWFLREDNVIFHSLMNFLINSTFFCLCVLALMLWCWVLWLFCFLYLVFQFVLVLYCHLHVHAASQRHHNLGAVTKTDTVIIKMQEDLFNNIYHSLFGGCPRGVMVKAMNCGIVVREFVLQSRYYVHFRANTLGKGMNPLILPPAMDE